MRKPPKEAPGFSRGEHVTSDITIIGPGDEVGFIDRARPNISGAVTDEEIIALWLTECRSRHTLRIYERVAFRLLQTLPHGLRGATVTDIARFEATIQGKPNTRHTTMSIVRSLYGFAQRTGYISISPAHIRRNTKPAHNSRGKCLTEEELWLVIDGCERERDRIMLRFLYATVVRVSEMCGLLWSDIQERNKGQIAHILGKRSIYRPVPIPAWVGLTRPPEASSADAVFTVAGPNDPHPWPPMSDGNVRRIITNAALNAGVRKKVSPHWFRHSGLTHLQDRGVSILTARDLAGHSNINTTSTYSHTLEMGVPGDVLERKDRN